MRNVEQRFATILSVSQAIVKRQRHFLEYGALAMKPLGLREIAEEVGLHESTVSRVTNNKYMATPLGVFELKYFFSRAMHAKSGGEFSGTAIRGLIKDMIDSRKPERAAVGRRDRAATRAAGAGGGAPHGHQVPPGAAHRGGRAAPQARVRNCRTGPPPQDKVPLGPQGAEKQVKKPRAHSTRRGREGGGRGR